MKIWAHDNARGILLIWIVELAQSFNDWGQMLWKAAVSIAAQTLCMSHMRVCRCPTQSLQVQLGCARAPSSPRHTPQPFRWPPLQIIFEIDLLRQVRKTVRESCRGFRKILSR